MDDLSLIQKIAVWAIPLIYAITLHEVAHGWVASFFGDQTARLSGRLSLNPIKHISLVGTIIVPLLLLVTTRFVFGWAKPVPVDGRNLRHPRRDMAIVALAGPTCNLLMALVWGLLAKIGLILEQGSNQWIGVPLLLMGIAGIQINVMLGVLNFIPIPPLDGANVLSGLLPPRMAYQYGRIAPYGFYILLLLMLTGMLYAVMAPLVIFFINLVISMYGLQ